MLAFCEANESRSRALSAARTSSTTARRATSAPGVGMDRRWRSGSRTPTSLLAIGGRARRGADAGLHAARAAGPRQTLVHVHPGPRELGRVYEPDLAILGDAAGARERARRGSTPVEPRGASGRPRRAPTTSRPPARADFRATSTWARSWRSSAPASGRRDPNLRRRQLHRLGCTASSSSREYPHAARAASGAMGYGLPAAVAAQVRRSASARGLLRGRRRLPDGSPELATAVQYERRSLSSS